MRRARHFIFTESDGAPLTLRTAPYAAYEAELKEETMEYADPQAPVGGAHGYVMQHDCSGLPFRSTYHQWSVGHMLYGPTWVVCTCGITQDAGSVAQAHVVLLDHLRAILPVPE